MKIIDLRTTDLRVTSLEILEQINVFRKEEKRVELHHKTLLEIIRDEFEEEINEQKILPIEYLDSKNRKQPMFRLTTNQARQILMRESRIVRKKVVAYIEELENKLFELMNNQNSKKLQMELMEDLQRCLPELEKSEALSYIKANTVVNKLVSDIYGFPKMLKKFEMNPDMLASRELVLDDYVKLYEILKDNSEVREALNRKYKKQTLEVK